MLNTLLMSFSENLAVLVALLVFFIWFQSRRHRDNTVLRELIANQGKDLRGAIADSNKGLREEIEKVSGQVTQVETNLREEIGKVKDELGKVSDRVARIEGQLGSPPRSGNPRPRRKSG